jgi:hypothetical protein
LLSSLSFKSEGPQSGPVLRRGKPPGVRGPRTWRVLRPKKPEIQGNAGILLTVLGDGFGLASADNATGTGMKSSNYGVLGRSASGRVVSDGTDGAE